jgi:hypothetical protein
MYLPAAPVRWPLASDRPEVTRTGRADSANVTNPPGRQAGPLAELTGTDVLRTYHHSRNDGL